MTHWVERLVCGTVATFLLVGVSAAQAQTFHRLAQYTWTGTDLAETFDHPIIQNGGHIDRSNPLGNNDSQVFWWDSFGQVRLNRQDPSGPLVGYRVLTIDAGTDGRLIKSTMDEIDLALGVQWGKFNGWTVSTVLGAGYNSTHPFVNSSGVYGIGHVTAEHPIDEKDSLLLSVDYEGNGGFLPDVPLPGFAWQHRGSQFTASLGYPYNRVVWQPTLPWQFTAQYVVPYSAVLDAQYRIAPHFGVYADAMNFFQGFVLASGQSVDRQFYQMRTVEAGLRIIDQPLFDASIGVGYAFDQTFADGYDVRSLRSIGRISNEPYVAFVLRGVF